MAILKICLFPSVAFSVLLVTSIRAMCHTHFTLLDLITLVVQGDCKILSVFSWIIIFKPEKIK
jgi:hypothetical protein